MEGNLDASSIDACSGSGIEFSDSQSLKTSRWLQWVIEEGQVQQWCPVSPHTFVRFMSPWFVPSYTPTRNGSVDNISTLGSLVPVPPDPGQWQASPGGRRDKRERTWMQYSDLQKHRSQRGKRW